MDTEKPDTYGINKTGEGRHIFKDVTLGFPSRENLENIRKSGSSGKEDFTGVTIGDNFVLRPGTIIYSDVTIGDNFSSGHSGDDSGEENNRGQCISRQFCHH